MKRRNRIAIILLCCFVAFAIAAFFVTPPLARSVLATRLSETLGRPVSVGQILINPFLLRVTVREAGIKEKAGSGDLFSFKELSTRLDAASAK